MEGRMRYVVVLDGPDLRAVQDLFRAQGKILVADEDTGELRPVTGLTPAEQDLAAINAGVYAMDQAGQERWYRQNPLWPDEPEREAQR